VKKSPSLKRAADRLSLVSDDIHTRTRLARIELYEMDQRVMRREAIAEGRAKGMAQGRAKGMVEGMAKGRAEGRATERTRIANLIKQGATLDVIKKALLEQDKPKRKRS